MAAGNPRFNSAKLNSKNEDPSPPAFEHKIPGNDHNWPNLGHMPVFAQIALPRVSGPMPVFAQVTLPRVLGPMPVFAQITLPRVLGPMPMRLDRCWSTDWYSH